MMPAVREEGEPRTQSRPTRLAAYASAYTAATVGLGLVTIWEVDMMPSLLRGSVGGDLAIVGASLALGFVVLRRVARRLRRRLNIGGGARAHLVRASPLYAWLLGAVPWLATNAPATIAEPAPAWIVVLFASLVASIGVAADASVSRAD